ncbi:hypothetical protein DFS34DRAFT_48845 [Phlyctochytrium arcticum]|nr:hypothetical protein DFS34DRAFT_48845 [Phlyctochytrium arcticum]
MSMNKDEALRCLDVSKAKFQAGNTEAALKFAKKSASLCETQEGKDWLAFLAKHSSETSSTASSGSRPSSSSARSRPSASAKASSATPDDSDASTSRPFTSEQVEGIKRIKVCKTKGDLYAILGLEKGCSDTEIKKAYRKLALQFHPDKCTAPGTDDAFKAIGHAFAVLGDADKKDRYDRYGVDTDSRGGGGGGGGGAASPFGGGFETEISPEDLFNMFFGDLGGSGVRMHSFTGGSGFRTQSFRRHPAHSNMRPQAQATPAQAQILQLIQLLPFLFIFVLPLLSAFFSSIFPGAAPEPTFSFAQTSQNQAVKTTNARRVPYFVNQRQWQQWEQSVGRRGNAINRFEQDIETEWHRTLQRACSQEQETRRFRINQAQGWFTVDERRLKAAQNMAMPYCDRLAKFPTEGYKP